MRVIVPFLILYAFQGFSAPPNWTLQPSDFQYSMTAVTSLNVEGIVLESESDLVAAFVDGEVRGISNPVYTSSVDRYLSYLTIYSNTNNEVVEFKIYESSSDRVIDVETTINFAIDDRIGGVFQAFSLAEPVLSSEANLESFGFSGVEAISTTIENGTVNIALSNNESLMGLTPEFTISEGASMYIDREAQLSGTNSLDFTDRVVYSVLSQDESVLADYEILVTLDGGFGSGFIASNVVTANNDGSNDAWVVQDLYKYSNFQFKIMDTNGRTIYESIGYNNDWKGEYGGSALNRGNYFYIVEDTDSDVKYEGTILVIY